MQKFSTIQSSKVFIKRKGASAKGRQFIFHYNFIYSQLLCEGTQIALWILLHQKIICTLERCSKILEGEKLSIRCWRRETYRDYATLGNLTGQCRKGKE